ncbi:MAG: hypothetical protein HY898_28600 [Deltaproteobacteria bacterium]|nr:hypothetical protein [Deltaproteobacteria bacterium]
MLRCLPRPALLAAALASCASPAPARHVAEHQPPAAPAPAVCVQRTTGNVSERIYFDALGNVLSTARSDGGGSDFHWARNGQLLGYESRGRNGTTSGVFVHGAHGEVTAVRIHGPYLRFAATLSWDGTFSAARSTARPFATFGGAAGFAAPAPVQILSANLQVRHIGNPMYPVRFTGKVHVTVLEGGSPREVYAYQDGRLLRWEDDRGNDHTYTWDADGELVEQRWCEVPQWGMSESRAPECHSSRTERVDGKSRVTMDNGRMTFEYDEQERLVSGQYQGKGDSATWSRCEVRAER